MTRSKSRHAGARSLRSVAVAILAIVILPASVATATVPASQQTAQGSATVGSHTGAGHVFDATASDDDGGAANTSRFETGDDGWRITGDAQGGGSTPEYLASGGNPGGHVCANDNVAGGTWYFSAPADFLGDRADAYGGTLAFDIKQSSTTSQFAQDDIVLRNETRTIVYDFGDESAHPGTNWTSYSVPLSASNASWTFDSGGEVSATAFRTLLGDLTRLSIRGEYVSGSDRGCLDNVRLSRSTASTAFDVALDSTNAPVAEGETLTVDATVENTGRDTRTETIALSISDAEAHSVEVTLEPDQRRTVSLSWPTGYGDAGTYRATVRAGSAVDSTSVTIEEQSVDITFEDQQVADVSYQEVVVGSAFLPSSGFLVVYNGSVGTNPDPGRILGVSGVFASGEHENVRVTLDERIVDPQTLTVVAHNDTNRINVFDGAGVDTPFTVDGAPLNDTASITMRTPTEPSTISETPTPTPTPVTTQTPTATPTPTPTPTATPTATPTPTAPTSESVTTSEDGPGFGVETSLLALVSAVLLAGRTRLRGN